VRSFLGGPLGASRNEQSDGVNLPIFVSAGACTAGLAAVFGVVFFRAKTVRPPQSLGREGVPSSEDASTTPALRREVIFVDFLTQKTMPEWEVADDPEELESSPC
jgi:hypothetical protein